MWQVFEDASDAAPSVRRNDLLACSWVNHVSDVGTLPVLYLLGGISLVGSMQYMLFFESSTPQLAISPNSTHTGYTLLPIISITTVNNAKEIKSSTMKLASIWAYTFATLAAAGLGRNPQDCAVVIGFYESIAYRYYAHSKDCATMSQVDIVEQVLHHKLGRLDPDDIPSSDCVKFDEGGSLQG